MKDSRNDFDPTAQRRCCACGKTRGDVKNIACLPYKAPQPGSGWSCDACGLPADGALALVCDECAYPKDPDERTDIMYAYDGKIGSPSLIAVARLLVRQEHLAEKHMVEE